MNIKNTRIWKYAKKKRGERILVKQYLKNKKMPLCKYEEYLVNRTCEMMRRYDYTKPFVYKVNFANPQTYTEKIQWLKLYDQDSKKSEFTDKYLVRKYIKKTIGNEYLVPLISIDGKDCFTSVREIDFSKLPNQFVLKCTHGSHMNVVVRNKDELKPYEIKKIKRKLNKWLKMNYAFWVGLELQYSSIKPMIIIEQYIGSNSSLPIDYKFFCYDNEVKFLSVNENRGNQSYSETYFDLDFKKLPYTLGYYANNNKVSKPKHFSQMVNVAKQLCVGFKHVRVDLYDLDEHIYFGELTFSPGAGFDFPNPFKYDRILGDLIKIDEKIRKNKKEYRKE